MRTKAKDQTFFDAIQDTSCYAMMQDTTSNGSYISRDWQYGFSQTYNRIIRITATTPRAGNPGRRGHPPRDRRLGRRLRGRQGHAQAGREHRRLLRAKTQGISGMSGTLVWQGDNGAVYNPGETVPGTVQTLTLCTKLAITTQPSSATAVQGATARFTVRRRARWAISGR